MVWFSCEDCGDTVKKPKLSNHKSRCSASNLTCVDCQATFAFSTALSHDTCFTEHEKYALAKNARNLAPSAKASAASVRSEGDGTKSQRAIEGEEHLANKPPWKCFLCNVTCTSYETLRGHASGKRHVSKARAAKRRKQSWSELMLDVLARKKQEHIGFRHACIEAARLAAPAGSSSSANELERLRKECKRSLKQENSQPVHVAIEHLHRSSRRGKRRKLVKRLQS